MHFHSIHSFIAHAQQQLCYSTQLFERSVTPGLLYFHTTVINLTDVVYNTQPAPCLHAHAPVQIDDCTCTSASCTLGMTEWVWKVPINSHTAVTDTLSNSIPIFDVT